MRSRYALALSLSVDPRSPLMVFPSSAMIPNSRSRHRSFIHSMKHRSKSFPPAHLNLRSSIMGGRPIGQLHLRFELFFPAFCELCDSFPAPRIDDCRRHSYKQDTCEPMAALSSLTAFGHPSQAYLQLFRGLYHHHAFLHPFFFAYSREAILFLLSHIIFSCIKSCT